MVDPTVPPLITGEIFDGVLESIRGPGAGRATFILDLISSDNTITGNLDRVITATITGNFIVVNQQDEGVCICAGDITGTQTGPDLLLESGECDAEFRPRFCDNPDDDTGLCPVETVTGSSQFVLSGSGNQFTGTFFSAPGEYCLGLGTLNNTATATVTVRP